MSSRCYPHPHNASTFFSGELAWNPAKNNGCAAASNVKRVRPSVKARLKLSFSTHGAPHIRCDNCIVYLHELMFLQVFVSGWFNVQQDAVMFFKYSMLYLVSGRSMDAHRGFFSARGIFGLYFLNQRYLSLILPSTNSPLSRQIVPVFNNSRGVTQPYVLQCKLIWSLLSLSIDV